MQCHMIQLFFLMLFRVEHRIYARVFLSIYSVIIEAFIRIQFLKIKLGYNNNITTRIPANCSTCGMSLESNSTYRIC